ncbi:class I SAM-dependent methyltransferase [Streptomyces rhizosphaericola]|uniref:class I SAM-dependent methyltransferase n=1 Tax=Streptomyces rhizosphaericola TaxID=2564098 RepID=UPI001F0DC0F6|nr:class I SAM-dependent methyltransferase [Streptomyces rhizosphaericola]
MGRSLRGRRVLELGCGQGQNAAHLVDRHQAQVTAIDLIDLQIQHARARYGEMTGLTLLACDALRYLQRTTAVFDIVYSVFGAIGLVEPRQLLAAIARHLRPHGVLAFSVPHPRRAGGEASEGPQPRHSPLRLPDGSRAPLPRWELNGAGWRRALAPRPSRSWAIPDGSTPPL